MTDFSKWKTALSCKKFDGAAFDSYKKFGIELIEISPRREDYPALNWAEIKSESERTGVKIWSVHLPFSRDINISLPDRKKREDTVCLHSDYMQKAAEAGARVAVIHPSSEPIDERERGLYLKNAKASLKVLADRAQELGLILAVENLPRTCLCRDSEETAQILKSDDRLRFCFDVNHLLIDSHARFLERFASKLVTLHISDYDFKDERHALPGCGKIDWRELVLLLEKADYSGPFLYEVNLDGRADGEMPFPPTSVCDIRKNHMNIKSFTGNGRRL
ncbi:MAG: sugar phosphate isomerase/epimerase [Clostridia bacterium]|nr:sugar phosphate isomerase/epimerase [Clostridia bacterium]